MPLEAEVEKPLVWGVEIDSDEANFLSLLASIADLPVLDVERMKTDIQAMACKLRMDMSNNEAGRETNTSQRMDAEIDASTVFDCQSNTLDFRKQKVTDMKNCRRVFVPGPCKKETKLQALISSLEDIVEKTAADDRKMKDGMKRSGFPRDGYSSSVLTQSQTKGKDKLLTRQAAGECVLCRTDKSGKMCVLSKDLYIKKMLPHIENDMVVEREEVKVSENAECNLCSTCKGPEDWK